MTAYKWSERGGVTNHDRAIDRLPIEFTCRPPSSGRLSKPKRELRDVCIKTWLTSGCGVTGGVTCYYGCRSCSNAINCIQFFCVRVIYCHIDSHTTMELIYCNVIYWNELRLRIITPRPMFIGSLCILCWLPSRASSINCDVIGFIGVFNNLSDRLIYVLYMKINSWNWQQQQYTLVTENNNRLTECNTYCRSNDKRQSHYNSLYLM